MKNEALVLRELDAGPHGRNAAKGPELVPMPGVFITCTPPRSMAPRHATECLERHADDLRKADPVQQVILRELRPRSRDLVWLLHAVCAPDAASQWEELFGALVSELRALEMDPTICIDERSRDVPAAAYLDCGSPDRGWRTTSRVLTQPAQQVTPNRAGRVAVGTPVCPAERCARELLRAVERVAEIASESGSPRAIPAILQTTGESLRILSATCYGLARDTAPGMPQPLPLEAHSPRPARGAPPREWEMALVSTVHQAETGMARAAGLCEGASRRAARLLDRRFAGQTLPQQAEP